MISWIPVVVIGAMALIMAGILILCAVLVAKGIKQQKRYNSTTLPSLVVEAQEMDEDFPEEEMSAFDLDTAEDDYDDKGFESDKWFARARDIDNDDLKEIRKRRSRNAAVAEQEPSEPYSVTSDELMEGEQPEPKKKRKRSSLPEL